MDYIIEIADVNRDGLISFREFESVAKRGLLPPANGAYKRASASNNFNAAQDRRKVLPTSSLLNKREVSQLKKLFDDLDVNGDGTLDKRELRMIIQEFNLALSEKEITDWINKADSNGDGAVDFTEFVEAYERQQQGNLSN